MEAVFICHKSNNWHEMRIAGRTKAEAVMLLLAFADGVIACVRQYQYRGIGAAFYLLLTGLLLAVVLGRDFGNFRRFRQTKPYDVQFYQDHFDVITPETQEAQRRPYSMLHKIVVCPNTVCLYVIGGERYSLDRKRVEGIDAAALPEQLKRLAPQIKIKKRKAAIKAVLPLLLVCGLVGGMIAATSLRDDSANARAQIAQSLAEGYPTRSGWKMEEIFSGDSFTLMRCYIEESDSQLYLYTRDTFFGITEVEHITIPFYGASNDVRSVEHNRYVLVFVTTTDKTGPFKLTDEYGNEGVLIPVRDGQAAVLLAKRIKGKYHYYANEHEFCTILG